MKWFKKKCVCGSVANTKHELVFKFVDENGNHVERKIRLCSDCVRAMELSGKVVDGAPTEK